MIQQGWECPRCKTINAPFMVTCGGLKCHPQVNVITTDSADRISTEDLNEVIQKCTCENCVPDKYKK